MLNQVSRTQLFRHSVAAGLAMIVWLLLVARVPIVGQMPGVAILAATIVIALTFDHRPALIAVALGAIGFETIRAAPTMQAHIVRGVGFAILGGALVALVYARTVRTHGALQYRTLFERHPLPMWVSDADTLAFLAVNQAAVRTYGFSEHEFARMTVKDVRLAEDPPRLEAPLASDDEETTESWRHVTKSGQMLDVFVRSQAITLPGRRARLALIEDVTERRSIEEQLRQSQKMEAIGRLAGGIAHDFNNLLTAIRGYAALLLDSLPADDPRYEDAAEIDRAGERAAALTRQLLAFSRKQLLHVRVVSLTHCLEDILPMLPRVLGETIELRTIMRAESRIRCDPSQLQQVLMNLVVNARDALTDGGRITIETEDVVLDSHYTSHHATVRPGPHAVLIVSDNGCGMDAATQSRVFEPFFTTKPSGEGTGLGLATVYGIVKQSGGHIWLYSEVNHGTTFKIYFPITDAPEDAAEPSMPADARRRGRGTILIVEDENGVRSLMTRLLERRGYTVLSAASPGAAREIWDRPATSIDLLITDLVLPGMSGRQVANEMRLRHPGCPVLFMSGYTKDGVVTNGVLHEDADFLPKPFAADELLNRVATALNDVKA